MPVTEEFFNNRASATRAAAQRVTTAITDTLDGAQEATIIVTGGATPENSYRVLADTALPWNKVHIMLSDERCVAPNHEARNEAMVKRLLVTHHAKNAKLASIYDHGQSDENQCRMLTEKINSLPAPYSIALLGMGDDGHIASLFADSDRLDEGLDPDSNLGCLLVKTAASKYSRVTLTLSALLNSREILLLFFGDAKRDIYEQAKQPNSSYPVSRLLLQQRTPVHTIWAP